MKPVTMWAVVRTSTNEIATVAHSERDAIYDFLGGRMDHWEHYSRSAKCTLKRVTVTVDEEQKEKE